MPAPRSRRSGFSAVPAEVCEARRLLTTFTVTGGGDATDAGDGVLTYREALDAAEANAGADTIVFADGVDVVRLDGDLGAYAGDFTVDGGGDVEVRHRGRRGMTVDGGAVTLTGLTLRGADAGEANGGALSIDGGADVTLTEVRFLNNTAAVGGAVYASGGSALAVSGGRFEGNVARSGGAVALFGGTGAFTGTSFVGNSTRAYGGAVYGNFAAVTVTDAFAVENVAGVEDGELRT